MIKEAYSDYGPKCPHCGRQFEPDQPLYYDPMSYTKDVCDTCDKPFEVEVIIDTTWRCTEIE